MHMKTQMYRMLLQKKVDPLYKTIIQDYHLLEGFNLKVQKENHMKTQVQRMLRQKIFDLIVSKQLKNYYPGLSASILKIVEFPMSKIQSY